MATRVLLVLLLSTLALQYTYADKPKENEPLIDLPEEYDVSEKDFWDKSVDLEEPEQEILDPSGLFYAENS